MKKVISVLITMLLCLGLVGCGETNLDPNKLEQGETFDWESLKDKKVKIDVETTVEQVSETKDGKASIFLTYQKDGYQKTFNLKVNDKDNDGANDSKGDKVKAGDKITIKSGVVTDSTNHIITVDEKNIIPVK